MRAGDARQKAAIGKKFLVSSSHTHTLMDRAQDYLSSSSSVQGTSTLDVGGHPPQDSCQFAANATAVAKRFLVKFEELVKSLYTL